jgi:Protein of unknown function (DUF3179)
MGTPYAGRRFLWYLLPCLLVSLGLLVYPIYVIRPFRAQGPRELMLALGVMRYRPAALGVCVGLVFAAMASYWRKERRWPRRAASAAGLLAVCAAALLSRVNIYELMFHPIERPAFLAAGASKLDGGEKVIAVRLGGQARAYPVRGMSYHHVVNDQVGGVAIAATY